MRLNGKFVGQLTEADLIQLKEDGRYEDQNLDFKVAAYGRSDTDKRELLKDVVGFANSTGGVILIGVDDIGDQATDVPGIELENNHDPMSRYERTIRDGTEPPLHGCQLAAIPVGQDGRVVVAIGIPASLSRPHRTKLGSGRWTIRRNRDTEDMTYSEIRSSFLEASTINSRIKAFHVDRCAYTLKFAAENGFGTQCSAMMIHVCPLGTEGARFDVRAVTEMRQYFFPPGQPGALGLLPHIDGAIASMVLGPNDQAFGWVKLYRDGRAEGMMSSYAGFAGFEGDRNRPYFFNSHGFELDAVAAVQGYIDGLLELGFNPPFVVACSLLGAEGSRIDISARRRLPPLSIVTATFDPVLLETVGDGISYASKLRPIFDQLWNAFGHPECRSYNADGNWVGDAAWR